MNRIKEVTIYDLATKLNVSVATVSRGLKNDQAVSKKTRKRISDLAEEMGYRSNHFARNLRQQRTSTIGVIFHELRSSFINSVLAGIEKITTESGYDLIITHSSESYLKEVANANNLFHKRVDGLIASLSFDTKDFSHFQPFLDRHIPLIFFDRVDEEGSNSMVIIDNYKCGYIAAKHLIEQGCKRLGHITSSLNRNVYAQRYRGFRDALFDGGLEFDPGLLIVNDLSEKAGIDSASEISKMSVLPDGLFITNDFVAAVCMQKLKEMGIRIPEDIAIVGFNNDAVSKLVEPALSTINYPGMEMGEIAARNLINHLTGVSKLQDTNKIIIRSELIIRKSSSKK
ncbi:MAG: LacI family DNA-binding transcriptional regulator [Ginsengibacter sp.]